MKRNPQRVARRVRWPNRRLQEKPLRVGTITRWLITAPDNTTLRWIAPNRRCFRCPTITRCGVCAARRCCHCNAGAKRRKPFNAPWPRAQDAEAWLGLGRAQLQLGECEAALQSLGHALAQIPHYFEALFYQGRAYFQLLDYEQACASYARAAALNAEEAVLWREYAEALMRAHQPEAALECWETVTQLQPTNADHWISYGSLLREMLRPAEAINSYDIALELAPQDFFAWFSRGLVLSDMARHEEAGKSFERALSLAPGDAAAQHQLALTYLPRFLSALAEGHVFDAREYWQRAVRLGRESRSADWHELELYYLQRAAALGHQQLVKALLTRLEGNALLEPLRHALDYLHTRNADAWAALSDELREKAERFVQGFGSLSLPANA